MNCNDTEPPPASTDTEPIAHSRGGIVIQQSNRDSYMQSQYTVSESIFHWVQDKCF